MAFFKTEHKNVGEKDGEEVFRYSIMIGSLRK